MNSEIKKNPFISVLLPVYNREAFLIDAVESVLAQEYQDYEIVIVDNQSTDRTWDVCLGYAEKFPDRIRVFQNPQNLGPVRNWMRCLEESVGEYIKILFSDDVVGPHAFEFFSDIINKKRVGLIITAGYIGETLDFTKFDDPRGSSEEYLASEYALQDYVRRYSGEKTILDLPVSPCAALFRREYFEKYLAFEFANSKLDGFAKTGAGPDLRLYLDTLADENEFVYTSKKLTFFRAHAGSFSTQDDKKRKAKEQDPASRLHIMYTASLLSFLWERKRYSDFNRVWIFQHFAYCSKVRGLISAKTLAEIFGLEGVKFPSLVRYPFSLLAYYLIPKILK